MPLYPGSKRTRLQLVRIRGCWTVRVRRLFDGEKAQGPSRDTGCSSSLSLSLSARCFLSVALHPGHRYSLRGASTPVEAIRQGFEISREDIRPCGGWPGKENVLAASRYLSSFPLISDTPATFFVFQPRSSRALSAALYQRIPSDGGCSTDTVPTIPRFPLLGDIDRWLITYRLVSSSPRVEGNTRIRPVVLTDQ